MREGQIVKSLEAGNTDLERINQYTRRPFSTDEVYVFSVILCDNEIDRDFDRFSIPALEKLKELYLGRTGIFDHSMKSGDQVARIFWTAVHQDATKKTKAGEPYTWLEAKAYLPRLEKTSDIIAMLESGILKEVSVGCAVAKTSCSICGADRHSSGCNHKQGRTYHGKLCCNVLEEPTDAYEWSFVAVPAQRNAGVIKRFDGNGREATMEQIVKKVYEHTAGRLILEKDEVEKLKQHMNALEEYAACGKEYRTTLCDHVTKLFAVSQPELEAQVIRRTVEKMDVQDLQAFEKALRTKTQGNFSGGPQLAPVKKPEAETNRAFQI